MRLAKKAEEKLTSEAQGKSLALNLVTLVEIEYDLLAGVKIVFEISVYTFNVPFSDCSEMTNSNWQELLWESAFLPVLPDAELMVVISG